MGAFAIHGPLLREDLPGLYARVCAQLARAPDPVVLVDVRDVEPDAVTVEALARLQLGARRHGCQVRLSGASPQLCQLIAFLGLTDVMPLERASGAGDEDDLALLAALREAGEGRRRIVERKDGVDRGS
jgi:ABC-type transporter Mla MlaB component